LDFGSPPDSRLRGNKVCPRLGGGGDKLWILENCPTPHFKIDRPLLARFANGNWLWVETSEKICVLMLAPTRSSAELEKLLGTDFEGILSSDCFSSYNPQKAGVKQKCLVHLERDLTELQTSRFQGNRDFAHLQEVVDNPPAARCSETSQ
jgi:hypothetical protein